jgi:hypothetical protein
VPTSLGKKEPQPAGPQLKDLELENSRLRKAVSDLTLDKLILTEAAKGGFLEEWFWRPAAIVSYSAGRVSGARAATAWHGCSLNPLKHSHLDEFEVYFGNTR